MVRENGAPIPANTTSILSFEATPSPTPEHAFSRIHVILENGTLARTTALVRFLGVDPDPGAGRELLPTAPYTLRADETARLGAVYRNSGECTTINRFTIDVPGGWDLRYNLSGGADFFAHDRFLDDPDLLSNHTPVLRAASESEGGCESSVTTEGWRIVHPRLIEWTGAIDVPPYAMVSFVVDAPIQRVPAAPDALDPKRTLAHPSFDAAQLRYHEPKLVFPENGFETTPPIGPGAWTEPGVYTFRVPPASAPGAADGYPHAAGGGEQEMRAELAWRAHAAPQTTRAPVAYTVAPTVPGLGDVEAAARNASVRVAHRVLPAGESTTVDVDYRSLVRTLGLVEGQANVTGLAHRLDVYAPPSVPGTPLWSSRVPLENTLGAAVNHVTSARLGGAGGLQALDDAHILAASGDGRVYALAQSDPDTAPVVRTRVADSLTAGALRVTAGADVDPRNADAHIAVIAEDGRVALVDGSDGRRVWADTPAPRGRDITHDARAGSAGLVIASHDTLGGGGVVTAYAPANGTRHFSTGLDAGNGTFGGGGRLHAFTPTADPRTRAVVVASASGVSAVLTSGAAVGADGVLRTPGDVLWTRDADSLPWVDGGAASGGSGRMLTLAVGDYDADATTGEEVLVAWEGGVAVMHGPNGTVAASWAFPAGAKGVAADARDAGAPLLVVADDQHMLTLLDLGLPITGSPVVWTQPAFDLTNVHVPEPDPWTVDCEGTDWVRAPGECTADTPGDVDPYGGSVDFVPDHSDHVNVGVTALALISPDGAPHLAPRVVVGYTTGESGWLRGVDAATGEPAWGPRHLWARTPTGITPVAHSEAPVSGPRVAVATGNGDIFLLEWNGRHAWDEPAHPGEPAGVFRYRLSIPERAIPGAHVVVATLEWAREVAPDETIAQAARATTLLAVANPDGQPLVTPYVTRVQLAMRVADWGAGS